MNTYGFVLEGAGEPLLHPDILELVATVKTAGFFTTLLTNGTLLKKDLIQGLIELKFDVVKVSLWAVSPEQYQQNYPGTDPDNFQKVKEGLKLMAKLKAEHKSKIPSVILHFPINRNNYQGIDALPDIALAGSCNGLSFAPMYIAGRTLASYALSPAEERSARRSLSRLRIRLDSLSLSHNIDEVLLRYEFGEAVWQKMPCYTPWFHARIRVDGTVLPCTRCDFSLGNIKDHSFCDIWNGSAVRTFRPQAIRHNKFHLLREHCDCNFCCFVGDNARVHRFIKWFLPFLHHSRKDPVG
jgi:MoaA/NifB/PqqE/SkfB family radical SAM enzyme